VSGFTNFDDAVRALANPATSGADLAEIAAKYPDLWSQVAAHPGAYPKLLAWLAQVGDDDIRAIIAARPSSDTLANEIAQLQLASSPTDQPMDPSRDHHQPLQPKGLIVLIASACVIVVAIVLALNFLVWHPASVDAPQNSGPVTVTVTETTNTTATSPAYPRNPLLDSDPPVIGTVQPLTLPDIPVLASSPITIHSSTIPVASIQKLANDVAAGDVEKIVKSCWTQPAEELRLVYGSAAMRGAILQALKQVENDEQSGAWWTGQYVTVVGLWEELDSSYVCPDIFWSDRIDASGYGLGSLTPAMAQWRITRALAVHDGNPVHSGDGAKYSLTCDSDCAMLWSPHVQGDSFNENAQSLMDTAVKSRDVVFFQGVIGVG